MRHRRSSPYGGKTMYTNIQKYIQMEEEAKKEDREEIIQTQNFFFRTLMQMYGCR